MTPTWLMLCMITCCLAYWGLYADISTRGLLIVQAMARGMLAVACVYLAITWAMPAY